MKTEKKIQGLDQLVEAICAGPSDPQEAGPEVVILHLADGEKMVGTYHECSEEGILVICDEVSFSKHLRQLIHDLLDKGESFVTRTGRGDTVCTLQWTIR